MSKSLKASNNEFSDAFYQLKVLNDIAIGNDGIPAFRKKLENIGFKNFKPIRTEILQINVGKMCNQTCKHCHVDAGPDRKEIMTRETMQQCLDVLDRSAIEIVDLTGGAPEMNPDFRWFVEEISHRDRHIIVRCNLTIILANPKYHNLPEFYRKHRVEVVSSLPHFSARRTDSQRGDGVFDKSISALKMLNEAGYGIEGTGLELNLVYNPGGAFLPPSQSSLERDFKEKLESNHGVKFNNLLAITNMPISRFLDYLVQTGNYEAYMDKLVEAFNPATVHNVMCRNTVSVGWDGYLYDCDFNQMLDLKVAETTPRHISDFNLKSMENREIVLNQHCFGCTAGAGSSCGGEIT